MSNSRRNLRAAAPRSLPVLATRPDWTPVQLVPFLVGLLWRLPRVVEATGAEIVLFSSMVTATTVLPLGRVMRRRGVRLAAIAHGRDVTFPARLYQRALPPIFDGLDLVLPVSGATADACVERGAHPDRVRIVPNGVDLARFTAVDDRDVTRGRLLGAVGLPPSVLPPDGLLLCSVGRAIARKGFRWFVAEVMPRLPPHVQYWVAGTGPEVAAIREAAASGGLGHRVRLLGRLTEAQLALLYQAADLFIMPNIPVPHDPEGFGIVMLEAGVNGLPTLAARLDGIPDVIREGENGHLLASGDPNAFVVRIGQYDRDRAALAAAARRAARFTAARFGWPRVASEYVEALRTVVRGRGVAFTNPEGGRA